MTRLYITVHPDSDSFRVETGGRFPAVFIEAPADDGRANAALRSRLTDILGTEPGIVSGHRSRRKQIAVDSLSEDEILDRLAAT